MPVRLHARDATPLVEHEGAYLVAEVDLPVVIASDVPVAAQEDCVGCFLEADWVGRWQWNPFEDEGDKEHGWVGRLSYGNVPLRLVVDGTPTTYQIRIVPGADSRTAMQEMQSDLDSFDEELSRGSGRTRQTVQLVNRRPRSGDEALQQYLMRVQEVVPALQSIGRRPLMSFRASDNNQTLDVPENRLIVRLVGAWRRDLLDIARLATHAAEEVEVLLSGLAVRASTKLAKGFLEARERDRTEFCHAATQAQDLAERLSAAIRDLRHIRPSNHVNPTPRMRLEPRYDLVFRASTRLRAEVAIGGGGRQATRPDALVSFLYEYWATLAIASDLVQGGWSPSTMPWVTGMVARSFRVGLNQEASWTFRHPDGSLLELWVEPNLAPLKSDGNKRFRSRVRALRRAARASGSLTAGLYTASRFNTPDLLLCLTLPDERSTLVVGDMIFAPCQSDDPQSPRALIRRRKEGLLRKANKVADHYGSKVLRIYGNGDSAHILTATEPLSMIIYPGQAGTEDWLADDDVLPMRLRPGSDEAQARATAVRDLLDRMREAAEQPHPIARYDPEAPP